MPGLRILLAAIAAALLPGASGGTPPPKQSHYLFYLHGRIVEDQGPKGVSPRYGAYDYPGILAAFRARGLRVVSEVRPSGTDPSAYADKVVGEVRALLAKGAKPSQITIVGASKGAVIATLVSTRLREPGLRYVLLANCNDWLIRSHDPRLTGEVLSIYERSDEIGGSCRAVAARSPGLKRFSEVALDTGLGHGIVYRPLAAWIDPAARWATR
jgi:hypothetical protein